MDAPDVPLRLFVALALPEAFRRGLAAEVRYVAALDPRARTVPVENVHVTLAFLGETQPDRVASAAEALEEAAQGMGAPRARLEGLGAFPSAARPRVVWAGLSEAPGDERLATLAARVVRALATRGFRVDDAERFHAHVTLARIAGRAASPALEKALTRGTLQDTYTIEMLSDLALMVSARPSAGRPQYRALARAPLAASTSASPSPSREFPTAPATQAPRG